MATHPQHGVAFFSRAVPSHVKSCAAAFLVVLLGFASLGSFRHSSARILSSADEARSSHSGGLTGVVFVGADNAVVFSRTLTPPAGAHAAAGATVSVGSVSGMTESTGAFTLENIPTGLGVLHVATAAGPGADFPVTIFAGVTASLGPPPVTRAAALAKVTNALSSIPTDPQTTIIIGPQEPLPVATVVAPVYGNDGGEPNAAPSYTVRTEQWFIYVDPNVLLRYSKPVQFFFVDAASGILTKLDETSWPLINGLSYYGNRDTVMKSPDLMAGPKTLPKVAANAAASHTLTAIVRDARYATSTRAIVGSDGQHDGARLLLASLAARPQAAPTAGSGTTYGLVIEGADESDQNADISGITQLFGHGGIPPASVAISKPTDPASHGTGNDPRRKDLLATFQKQCLAAGPDDTLFIYITAHGIREGRDGVQLERGVDQDGEDLPYDSLSSSNFDFSKCKACYIIIIIDACYSGAMASGFNDALRKGPCPPNFTIISATDSKSKSLGIPYYGGYFTQKYISAFSDQAAADPNATLDLTKPYQTAKGAAFNMLYQNPQIYVRSGCACNKPSTTPSTSMIPTPQPTSTTGGTGALNVANSLLLNGANTALDGTVTPVIQNIGVSLPATGTPQSYPIWTMRIAPRGPKARSASASRRTGGWMQPAAFHPGDALLAFSPHGLLGWMGTPEPQAGGASQPIYSLVANGNSSGEALELQVFDPSGEVKNPDVPEGMVLEPLKQGSAKSVSEIERGANILKKPLVAYCVDYAKLPPESGMLYRPAPQAVQDRYGQIRFVLQAGRELAVAGKFHPDSEPQAYMDSIRQYSLWAKIENWDQQKFGEVFLEKIKQNALAGKVKWSKQMEQAVSGLIPGRWRDISMVLDEAARLSNQPPAPGPGLPQ